LIFFALQDPVSVKRKAKVVKIVLTRAEGLTSECGKPRTVASFSAANSVLYGWSETAPKNGGYDKCDFVIHFAEGSIYSGRYDLVHWRHEAPNLGNHVRASVGFITGKVRPAHLTEAKFQSGRKSFADLVPRYLELDANLDLSDAQNE
jgi:hypothetical protein